LIKAKKSNDAYLQNMAAAMLDKCDKYWEVRNNLMVDTFDEHDMY
jgi:hypothetical protein